nr:MAG TPA: hypothetical protein [Caudoviricetes sp.]
MKSITLQRLFPLGSWIILLHSPLFVVSTGLLCSGL